MYNYSEMEPGSIEFVPIGNKDELPVNERIFVEIGDLVILVFNIAGGYFAIGDTKSLKLFAPDMVPDLIFEMEKQIRCLLMLISLPTQ